jgi:DegV family protein with EDD domain
MSVKIVADTGMDLPQDTIEKYDIEVLDMPVNDGENEYSRSEITTDKLFEDLKNGKVYGTSQVSAYDYRDCFTKHAKNNDEVIYISLSSGLTSSYNLAVSIRDQVLEEYKDAKIYIYDSKSASYGLGVFVGIIAKMAKNNESFEYIISKLDEVRLSSQHYFAVTDFKYLVRGGRLPASAATIGKMLNIKPLLYMNREDGRLYNYKKLRGEKNLHKALVNKYVQNYKKLGKEQTVYLVYGDDISIAKSLKEKILEEIDVNPDNLRLVQMGTVIGSHTGPGILCIFYSNKDFGEYNIF